MPQSALVHDVNGDGQLDLVVGTVSTRQIIVVLGNGDGTFQYQAARVWAYAMPSEPDQIAAPLVSDVDGDSRPDLVLVFATAADTYLGYGDGSFQGRQRTLDSAFYRSPALDDVTGDGRPDLVIVGGFYTDGYDQTGIGLLIGRGDGTFQRSQRLLRGSSSLGELAIADANGDGGNDIIEVTGSSVSGSSLGILFGHGDGTFEPLAAWHGGYGQSRLGFVDVNGDRMPDALLFGSSNHVSILLGLGDGRFQGARHFYTGSPAASDVIVGDVNGDQRSDVLTWNSLLVNATPSSR